MREDLVLKTAVLAERFYPTLEWYVDSMLTLIERAGELATKDIWHSTVQIITNYPSLHEYAARKVGAIASNLDSQHLILAIACSVRRCLLFRSTSLLAHNDQKNFCCSDIKSNH